MTVRVLTAVWGFYAMLFLHGWNTCGYSGSSSYGADGERKVRRWPHWDTSNRRFHQPRV